MPPETSPSPSRPKPFQITLRRLDETPAGKFDPGASVEITSALRTSGLLLALPGEELRTLLFVLTFAHPNGHVQPALLELARALRLSPRKARERMVRLQRFSWNGKPLLHELRRENGLHAWTPSPRILGTIQEPSRVMQDGSGSPTIQAAGREAVVAHSRAAYARPREEVEAEIARLNGWEWPSRTIAQTQEELRRQALAQANAPPVSSSSLSEPTTPLNQPAMPTSTNPEHDSARRLLLAVGVPRDTAADLVARFEADRILRQVQWLPLRKANNPVRFLVAAIEGDYEAPLALRRKQLPPPPDETSPPSETQLLLP